MQNSEPGQDPEGGGDARLRSLEERLHAAHNAGKVASGHAPAQSKGSRQGNRVLAELIGAPAGGALIGWLLDRWLETLPWCLLAGVVLGFAVAFRNILKISKERPD
jgi:ATP synthase protein I